MILFHNDCTGSNLDTSIFFFSSERPRSVNLNIFKVRKFKYWFFEGLKLMIFFNITNNWHLTSSLIKLFGQKMFVRKFNVNLQNLEFVMLLFLYITLELKKEKKLQLSKIGGIYIFFFITMCLNSMW